jgi:ribosomal protein S19
MSRSIWKGSFLDNNFIKKISKKQKIFSVWSRQTVIPQILIGCTVLVHTGKFFKKLLITREKIGFKFGAFIVTRTKPKLQIKTNKNLKIKKKK